MEIDSIIKVYQVKKHKIEQVDLWRKGMIMWSKVEASAGIPGKHI